MPMVLVLPVFKATAMGLGAYPIFLASCTTLFRTSSATSLLPLRARETVDVDTFRRFAMSEMVVDLDAMSVCNRLQI